MAGARQIIDSPTFGTLPYGLWDAVQQPAFTGPHWQNGVTWIDVCPSTVSAAVTAYDECTAVTGTGGGPPSNSALSANVVETFRGATPFTIYAEFDASPIGLDALGARGLAETNLARVENFNVEQAFWTGLAAGQTAVYPHLAANTQLLDTADSSIVLQTAASPLVTGGANAAVALGTLEQTLASCYGGQAFVHVPRSVLPTLAANKLVDWTKAGDGQLYTRAGNRLVVGGGYTGSSPAGASGAAGTAWIYGTGQVFGFRSDVEVMPLPGTFDRQKNTMKNLAMRTYVLGWECCHAAALVNLGVPANTTG